MTSCLISVDADKRFQVHINGKLRTEGVFPWADEHAQELHVLTETLERSSGRLFDPACKDRTQELARYHDLELEIGLGLARLLFNDETTDEVRRFLIRNRPGSVFRLLLRLEPPILASLSWELLRWPAEPGLRLAIDPRFTLTRVTVQPQKPQRLLRGTRPLALLAMVSDPEPAADVPSLLSSSFERVADTLRIGLTPLSDRNAVRITICRAEQLEQILRREPGTGILHLHSHSRVAPAIDRSGDLLRYFAMMFPNLENPAGPAAALTPEQLERVFGADGMPLLVSLLSCFSAGDPERASHRLVESTLTETFLAAGCPAVLGMQGQLIIEGAETLSEVLYRRLGELAPLDQAVQDARAAMYALGREHEGDIPPNHWWRPALFARDELDLELFGGALAVLRVCTDGEGGAGQGKSMPEGANDLHAREDGGFLEIDGAITAFPAVKPEGPEATDEKMVLPEAASAVLGAWLEACGQRGARSNVRIDASRMSNDLPWEQLKLPAAKVDRRQAVQSVALLPNVHVFRASAVESHRYIPTDGPLRLLVIGLEVGPAGLAALKAGVDALRQPAEMMRGDTRLQIEVSYAAEPAAILSRLKEALFNAGGIHLLVGSSPQVTPEVLGHLLMGVPLVTVGGGTSTIAFTDALVRCGVPRAIGQHRAGDILFGQLWSRLARGLSLAETLTALRRDLSRGARRGFDPESALGTRGGYSYIDPTSDEPLEREMLGSPGLQGDWSCLAAFGGCWDQPLVRVGYVSRDEAGPEDWLRSGPPLGTHPAEAYLERLVELDQALGLLEKRSLLITGPPGSGKSMLAAHLCERLRKKAARAESAVQPGSLGRKILVNTGPLHRELLGELLERALPETAPNGTDTAQAQPPGSTVMMGRREASGATLSRATASRLLLVLDEFESNFSVDPRTGQREVNADVPVDELRMLADPHSTCRVVLVSRTPLPFPGGGEAFAHLPLEPLGMEASIRLLRQLPRLGRAIQRSVRPEEIVQRLGSTPGAFALLEHTLAGRPLGNSNGATRTSWSLPLIQFSPPTVSREQVLAGLELVAALLNPDRGQSSAL